MPSVWLKSHRKAFLRILSQIVNGVLFSLFTYCWSELLSHQQRTYWICLVWENRKQPRQRTYRTRIDASFVVRILICRMKPAATAATNHSPPPLYFWRYRRSSIGPAPQQSLRRPATGSFEGTASHLPDPAYPYRDIACTAARPGALVKCSDSERRVVHKLPTSKLPRVEVLLFSVVIRGENSTPVIYECINWSKNEIRPVTFVNHVGLYR